MNNAREDDLGRVACLSSMFHSVKWVRIPSRVQTIHPGGWLTADRRH